MKILEPVTLGDLKLKNRVIMAPLTRSRAGVERIPNDLMAEYYRQRASAGMILTEATCVSARGVGYPDTPGIWSSEQVTGWKKITRAVHEAGGKIVLQLWHVGRISHPDYLNGQLPVAPSAIAPKGHVNLLRPKKDYVTPHALTKDEIKNVVEEFKRGAQNAMEAGFDGVEIHGANGYLVDQFLQDSANRREDEYGGSLSNRVRFLLEVTDAVISVWGASRVGLHIAPRGDSNTMGDSNPLALFTLVATEMGSRRIAFICAREHTGENRIGPQIKTAFGGAYIANEKFTLETAEQIIERGEADAVAFGKLFISNPDLPKRFALGAPLNPPNPETFYTPGAHGYTDYSTLE